MRDRTARAGAALLALLLATACGSRDAELTGAELAREVGCLACHDDTDTDLAPGLQGVWGSERLLADGRTVVADEAYVRKSIIDPGADVVAGYYGRMPSFALSDAEIDLLVDYVRSQG